MMDYSLFIKKLKNAGGSANNEIELRQRLQVLKQGKNNVSNFISKFKTISDLL